MKVQSDIGIKMRDRIHLELFFLCCRCGESICSTGIANDYHYPLWFIKDPIFSAEDGYVCSECAKKNDIDP
jgi:hypothetical protein